MPYLIVFPLYTEVIMIVIISLIITFIGFIIVRKKFSPESLSESHTVASYIFNAFSVTYAVLLAFVVYSNWFDYEKSQENVANETSYLSNFYRDTRTLPDSIKNVVTDKLINYTKAVLNDEWQTMSKGTTSPLADSALDDLWATYTNIPISYISNPYLYQLALERLNFISQYRRLRILDMEQTTPSLIWVVLITCGLISAAYTYYFTTKRKRTHFFLIVTVILINVLLFYLIYVLDHPYEGYAKLSSEPFQHLLNKFIQFR
jgi:hypothetical protein